MIEHPNTRCCVEKNCFAQLRGSVGQIAYPNMMVRVREDGGVRCAEKADFEGTISSYRAYKLTHDPKIGGNMFFWA